MKNKIILVIVILGSFYGYSQQNEGIDIIKRILNYNETFSQNSTPFFKVSGMGIHKSDLHLSNRNYLNMYHLKYDMEFSEKTTEIYFSSTITNQKNAKEEKTEIRYINDKEYIFNGLKNEYIKTSASDNLDNLIKTYCLHPLILLKYIDQHRDEIDLESKKFNDHFLVTIKFPNSDVWVLKTTLEYQCISFKHVKFDFLYGDTFEEIIWGNYSKTDYGYFPSTVSINNKGYEEYRILQEIGPIDRTKKNHDLKNDLGKNKEIVEKSPIISVDSINLYKIAENLYEVQLKETNSRLMLAEFENSLFLLGGCSNSLNGDLIINYIQQKFLNKHVKYASFSQGRTPFIGISRSLVANKTTILTTKDNSGFIRKISKSPFLIRPDNQENLHNIPKIIEVVNNWELADENNKIIIYSIESNQTDKYLIYYFPKQKIIFAGDLLWQIEEKNILLSDKKNTFFNEVIQRLKLDVETFYVSSPITNFNFKSLIDKKREL